MKNSNLVTRVISGIVCLIVVLAVGMIGGVPLFAFIALVGLIGLYEFYKAVGIYDKNAEDKKNNMLAMSGIIGSIIYFIVLWSGIISFIVYDSLNELNFSLSTSLLDNLIGLSKTQKLLELSNMTLVMIFVVIMLIVFMGIFVFTFPRFTFEKVAYALISIVYIPVCISFLYLIRFTENGKFAFWLIFISSWVCDTCAYFVGSAIGKHRLAPILSPKKSIEGSIGGIVGAVIVAFVFGYFVQYKIFGGANQSTQYMIICAIGAVVSQIGDLAASGIKRNHDIKDFGNLIPGHGGILDRFDSVIFVAPIIYILAILVL